MVIRELLVKLGFRVDTQKIEGFSKSVEGLKGKLSGLATDVAVAGAALAGAVYGFKAAFLDTAAQFERFQTILETTEGSSEGAKRAMDWVSDFAAKTPYELAQVTDAFVKLRAYGIDPTNGMLAALGDAAAAKGKDLGQGVEAIADAMMGNSERLKEFASIDAAKAGNTITYAWTDRLGKDRLNKVRANNKKEIQATLQAIFQEMGGGAMDKLSRTWDGMVSNLKDTWARFAKMVMNSGPFTLLKTELGGWLTKLDRMAKSGELQAWADKTARAMMPLLRLMLVLGKAVVNLGKWLVGWYDRLQPTIDRLGGLEVVVKRLLLAFVAIKAVQLTMSLIQTAQAAVAAARSFSLLGASSAPLAILAVLLLAIGLAIDDIITYVEGGDSAIGQFFKNFEEGANAGWVGALADQLREILGFWGLLRAEDQNSGKRKLVDTEDTLVKVDEFFLRLTDRLMNWKTLLFATLLAPLMPFYLGYQAVMAMWGEDIDKLKARIVAFYDGVVEEGSQLIESAVNAVMAFVDRILAKVKGVVDLLPGGAGGPAAQVLSGVGSAQLGLATGGAFSLGDLAARLSPAYSAYRAYQAVTNPVSIQGGPVNVNVSNSNASPAQISQAVQEGVSRSYRGALLNYSAGEE